MMIQNHQVVILSDLIAHCVMECYCREQMAERDLLFHDDVARLLEEAHAMARSRKERKENEDSVLSETLRAFAASREIDPIRNRLLRLTADSPDLLAVIKQKGRV